MAIQYSSGQIYTQFTCSTGTRREIVDGLTAALYSAGWSYSSGQGTGDVKMLTATTAQGSKCIVRVYDPGSGNCAKLFLYNSTSTLSQTGGCYLLPAASKTFKVIANPYQFFIFVLTSITAREFACGGTPWLPSWNNGITECGWLMGNATTDTDTTATRPTFRTHPSTVTQTNLPNMAWYTNSTFNENNNGYFGVNNAPGVIQLMGFSSAMWNSNNNDTINMSKWYDGSGQIYEPIIGWTSTNSPGNQPAVAIGQLWDAAMMTVPFAVETTTTFDSHNWINISNNAVGANQTWPRFSLWLVTP